MRETVFPSVYVSAGHRRGIREIGLLIHSLSFVYPLATNLFGATLSSESEYQCLALANVDVSER